MPRNTFKDLGLLRRTAAIPAASSTANSPPLDISEWADSLSDMIAMIEPPALTSAQLPNAATVTYILHLHPAGRDGTVAG